MRNTAKISALLAGLLGAMLLLSGCDKIPGLAKLNPAQPPEVAPVAPAPAAPAPVAVAASAASAVPAEPVPAPASAAAPVASKNKSEPSLEVRSYMKQGFAYISTAKNAREASIRDENIENALKEFSVAIQKDPTYAEAYSSRGATYMQQKKFNKAEEDLRRAKELAPTNASVSYNYACLHSLKGNVDLALDEIDAALTNGFTDYDALRLDPDLANLRKHADFRKILEKHKVFIVK